jgi:type IV secretory pathway TraG/TraD family ATPase VirD4
MRSYRLPDNPGFIGGIFWPGILFGIAARLIVLQGASIWIALAAQHVGVIIQDPHVTILGVPLYLPWRPFWWVFRYWLVLLFGHGIFHVALLSFLPGAICVHMLIREIPDRLFNRKLRRLAKNQDELYGSNRWATREDLEASHLFDGKGILLGAVDSDGK